MTCASVTLNLGDTFKATGLYKDPGGTPVNLTTAGITVSAEARSPDGLTTFDLTVTPAADQSADPGEFTVIGQTSEWTDDVGIWSLVIRYTQGTDKFSSERFSVTLV